MGLDTTHDCWHGPYSAFMRWRRAIAQAAGLPPLDLMEGFWSNPTGRDGETAFGLALSVRVAADTLDRFSLAHSPPRPGENLDDRPGASLLRQFDFEAISWEVLKPDPLYILLHHSDCEGSIESKDCGPIADSLERLLPQLDVTAPHPGPPRAVYDGIRAATVRFIAGLRDAAAKGEDVEFG